MYTRVSTIRNARAAVPVALRTTLVRKRVLRARHRAAAATAAANELIAKWLYATAAAAVVVVVDGGGGAERTGGGGLAGPFPITFLGAAVFKVKPCVRSRMTRFPRQNGVTTRSSSLSFDHFVLFPCSVHDTAPSPLTITSYFFSSCYLLNFYHIKTRRFYKKNTVVGWRSAYGDRSHLQFSLTTAP